MTWAVVAILVIVLVVTVAFLSNRSKQLRPPDASETDVSAKKMLSTDSSGTSRPTSVRSPIAEPSANELPSSQILAAESCKMRPPPAPNREEIAGLRKGLAASRGGFIARLASLFRGKTEIDPGLVSEVEEILLASDVGVKTTQTILERVRTSMGKKDERDPHAVWAALRGEVLQILSLRVDGLNVSSKPTVVLMVGVNGVGKTTTIGKLATQLMARGSKVMLAAGDTFRAAAVAQLEVWGKRVGAEVVKGKEGSDPGAVAFDATKQAIEKGVDVLLIDTAGRLHTKTPLMDEIRKLRKSVSKALDGAPHETLLILDATTGQNALQQAALFHETLELTGLVLTKLDGTAKGGIVVSICDELKLPVRFIGLGERADDLREFHAGAFVEALFGSPDDVAGAEASEGQAPASQAQP